MFKVGDRVKITLPEDVDDGPGHNYNMEDVLGIHLRMLTLSVKTDNNSWWRCVEGDNA